MSASNCGSENHRKWRDWIMYRVLMYCKDYKVSFDGPNPKFFFYCPYCGKEVIGDQMPKDAERILA